MNVSEALRTGVGVTMPEALSFGGLTTAVGMSIVFAVLVILMIVLYLFKVIFYKKPQTTQITTETEATPVVKEEAPQEDEEELIAILTAAVAASLNTSTYNLKIKSYRRVNNARSAWNKEGLRETIINRL